MTRKLRSLAGLWAVVLAGVAGGGCEMGDSSGGGASLISRDVLADGSVRTVYGEKITTETGEAAVRQTTITQPAAGAATTSVVVTVMSGMMPLDTNAVPANGTSPPQSPMPLLPGLPPGAVPLPPAP